MIHYGEPLIRKVVQFQKSRSMGMSTCLESLELSPDGGVLDALHPTLRDICVRMHGADAERVLLKEWLSLNREAHAANAFAHEEA